MPHAGLQQCISRQPEISRFNSSLTQVDHCNRLLYAVQSSYFPDPVDAGHPVTRNSSVNDNLTAVTDIPTSSNYEVVNTISPTTFSPLLRDTLFPAEEVITSGLSISVWAHLVCVLVGFLLGCVCYQFLPNRYRSFGFWCTFCTLDTTEQPAHSRVSFSYVSTAPAMRTAVLPSPSVTTSDSTISSGAGEYLV